jgi:hypothetical protein
MNKAPDSGIEKDLGSIRKREKRIRCGYDILG